MRSAVGGPYFIVDADRRFTADYGRIRSVGLAECGTYDDVNDAALLCLG